MDIHQLAELHLHTGYVFENGLPFYEKLSDERAEALLRALQAEGYRIVADRDVTSPTIFNRPRAAVCVKRAPPNR